MTLREPAGQVQGAADAAQRPAAAPEAAQRSEPSSAQIAKATLMRLAQRRLEPTPENYAQAWADAGGSPTRPDDGALWAQLVAQLVRGLEQGGRQRTVARKKASVRHVLASSSQQAQRLR